MTNIFDIAVQKILSQKRAVPLTLSEAQKIARSQLAKAGYMSNEGSLTGQGVQKSMQTEKERELEKKMKQTKRPQHHFGYNEARGKWYVKDSYK